MKKKSAAKATSSTCKKGGACDVVSNTIKKYPLKSVGVTALLVFLLF
jgi:hypothetical protein